MLIQLSAITVVICLKINLGKTLALFASSSRMKEIFKNG